MKTVTSLSVADAMKLHCPLLNSACVANACAWWLWRGDRPGDEIHEIRPTEDPGKVTVHKRQAEAADCRGCCALARAA